MSDTLNESLEIYMTAYKQMSELAALREENAALQSRIVDMRKSQEDLWLKYQAENAALL
jgi:hypothetical protein